MIYQMPEIGAEEFAALDAITALRKKLRFSTAGQRRWVGTVRRVLAARAIQASNSIEGYHLSVEDAIAVIDGDEPADPRSVEARAVSGYQRAMTYVIALADDGHFGYSADLLRGLHFMMTEYALDASPGRWRPDPIWVRDAVSGDAVYEAPEADEVPGLVGELVEALQRDDGPAMVRAAMAHLNLVMIHPFRDGNGRMSRCLQTLVLARERMLAPDLISIEEYLGRNTAQYYAVLADVGRGSWRPDGDARLWVRFCLEAHYVQAASVLRRIEESGRLWEEIERLRLAGGLPERADEALFDATIGLRVRNAAYRAVLAGRGEQISQQVATNDLRAMVEAGLLRAHGRNRGAHYEAAEPLRTLYAAVRRGRSPIDTSTLFVPSAPPW